MHEQSLVRALLRQVQQIALENSHGRVLSIRVRVGEFSGVEPELLTSAYHQLVRETELFGAGLEVERVPLEAVCDRCGSQFPIERFDFHCDQCGSLHLTLRGEELLLDSVTMEETVP